MAELGRAALILSLALAAYATAVGALAIKSRRRRLAASAQNALYAAFGTAAVATAVLIAAFARRDIALWPDAREARRLASRKSSSPLVSDGV